MTFMKEAASERKEERKPYDLSEKGSERGDEQSTRMARAADNDDVNEESRTGFVPGEDKSQGTDPENKVWTSSDDE